MLAGDHRAYCDICASTTARVSTTKPLKIRELKKVAVEMGWEEYRSAGTNRRYRLTASGSGRWYGSGRLSAAYFLARAGHPVTLFEREANAGGVVKNIIPRFRMPEELIQHDIDFVAEHGVKFDTVAIRNSPSTCSRNKALNMS